MRIVIGTLALASPGGTETHCLTVARELDRLGHEVTLFAEEPGPLAERAAAGGFSIAWSEQDLPSDCDAVLANDAVTACVLAERYAGTRLVYCFHSPVYDVQLPPLAPGAVHALVAPSERFAKRARALALDVPLIRLRQPIDVERFAPSEPPRSRPRSAVLLGNYLEGPRRDASCSSAIPVSAATRRR
ncbi:MAG TPA: glycosyltransferase [Solirubrobacteraceae bacterium]|nr:glycosyltransferase [Solirubrobacteraceae bacterium]